MIEITTGTPEEHLIRLLQKKYPITVKQVQQHLHISNQRLMRILLKFQTQGVLRLEPLSDTMYIRLLRHDFLFIGKTKHQKSETHTANTQDDKQHGSFMYQ
ncbi:MAG: transcriptional regulator [Candidatus Thermoplasmatota archaeon]